MVHFLLEMFVVGSMLMDGIINESNIKNEQQISI